MITLVAGNVGKGKTLFAVIDAYYNKINLHHLIYTNMNSLTFKDKYITSLEQLDDDNNPDKFKLLFLDEIYMWLDSRESITKRNRIRTYKFLQSRKDYYNIIGTLQDFYSIDVRFRHITDYLIYPEVNLDKHLLFYSVFNPKTLQILKTNAISFKPEILQMYNHREKQNNV